MDWIWGVIVFSGGYAVASVVWVWRIYGLREELAQERADRTIKEGNGPTASLLEACNLHVQEIKRLEAERDALREQVEQVKLRRSEGSKRGWAKRRAA
jgi:hypothetical protein